MVESEPDVFNYAARVDLHDFRPDPNIVSTVAIAAEHGFRSIFVLPSRLDKLVSEIKKFPELKDLVAGTIVDYPFGCSALDVRNYSVVSAKEKGAKEVEIILPYHYIIEKNFKDLEHDMRSISTNASKNQIRIRYIIDLASHFIDSNVLTRITRILANLGISISTSSGWFDKKIDHSDCILKLRSIKNKSNIETKAFLTDLDAEDLIMYNKAGIDIIGINWDLAVKVVYEYQEKLT